MEEQSWFDKNDDWIGEVMSMGGQMVSQHAAQGQSSGSKGGDSSSALNDAKGLPVAFNFPTWIPIVAVVAIIVYFFKKR